MLFLQPRPNLLIFHRNHYLCHPKSSSLLEDLDRDVLLPNAGFISQNNKKKMFDRLTDLSYPTIANIDQYCFLIVDWSCFGKILIVDGISYKQPLFFWHASGTSETLNHTAVLNQSKPHHQLQCTFQKTTTIIFCGMSQLMVRGRSGASSFRVINVLFSNK